MKETKIPELKNQTILNNPQHYKKTITYPCKVIIDKYKEVVLEYIREILENNKIKKNKMSCSIVIRGLDTITHVFRMIFYYSKNLTMTSYNTQRAYYYYIEFVDQMSEEDISYLKLNSNDAVLYVYKKTIYQLNQDYLKKLEPLQEKEKRIFELLDEYIYMFKNIFIEFISEKEGVMEDINELMAILENEYQEKTENDILKQIKWLKEKNGTIRKINNI
jgi:hypothetical protein